MRIAPAVELGDLRDRRVEQVAVVGDHHARRRRSRPAARRAARGGAMSRCASGSSSSSTSGRRARQAASATSLRWPPESSRVGMLERGAVDAERAQVAERLALGAVAAGLGPAGEQALVVGERARHRVEVGRRARGSARRRLGRVQLGLELGELRPRGAHRGARRRARRRRRSAAGGRARGRAGAITVPASACSSPARMRSSVDLPPPLGPSTPIREPASTSRSAPRRIARPPKDLVSPRAASWGTRRHVR